MSLRPTASRRRGSIRTRALGLLAAGILFVAGGRALTVMVLQALPAAGTAGPEPAPALALAGRTRLGGGIRSGFTADAAEAIHVLVNAFETQQVDLFAGLVDLDYELDYHRLLHDLESQFSRTDQIDMNMRVLSVEPLPEGFAAEVDWQKTFRVRRTGHRVHHEGSSRLVFAGSPPRLLSVQGQMPF